MTEVSVETKVREYFAQYPSRVYPKGHILVFADESPEHIYYLESGRVRKYDVSYRGDEVVVNIFKPGSFFPMSWAINQGDNKFFYKTEEKTELRIVPANDAMQFLKKNPDVMMDLLSRLYRGMEGVLGRLVQLMAGTAKSRLAYEIVIECERFGSKNMSGSHTITATEVDLAAHTGLSRETVSREMQKLKQAKLVSLDNKEITILDLAAIKKLLGSE